MLRSLLSLEFHLKLQDVQAAFKFLDAIEECITEVKEKDYMILSEGFSYIAEEYNLQGFD